MVKENNGEINITIPVKAIAEAFQKYLENEDVIRVVRCKDCRHRYVDGENVRYNVCELNHNKSQSDDWYCADGERREGEEG